MKLLLQSLVLALATVVHATAQEDIFLKIAEIPGESTASGHEKEIEVLAWSWGLTNSGAGKANWARLNVSKPVDKATPLFLAHCTRGRSIPTAVITLFAGRYAREYYRITLEDVRVSGVSFDGDTNGSRPIEQVQLAFSRMSVDYSLRAPDGSISESIEAKWDLITNSGGSSGSVPFNATLTFNAGAGTGQLKWSAVGGKTYEVLLATSPAGPFTSFGTYIANTTQMTVSVPFDKPLAFFRIREL